MTWKGGDVDSGFRRNDELGWFDRLTTNGMAGVFWIPAFAGMTSWGVSVGLAKDFWIPAFAGMTDWGVSVGFVEAWLVGEKDFRFFAALRMTYSRVE